MTQGEKRINILIAEDHPLMRQALINLLEKQTDFCIIGEACDGEEAVKLASELSPDVVIMDISMPKLNGLEAMQQIKAKCPDIAILVLTVHDDYDHVQEILRSGAAGYLTKSVFGEEVLYAIRSVVIGEMVLSSQISQQVVKHVTQNSKKPLILNTGEKVTAREREILKMAARGMSNKDIALALELSLPTIKTYLVNIFSKLGVSSRTEAINVCLKTGILILEDLG